MKAVLAAFNHEKALVGAFSVITDLPIQLFEALVQVAQGRLYFEGRLDSQVKVRGHRVDLAEIEKAVMEVAGVTKTIVLCYKPGDTHQRVLCYYTVQDSASKSSIRRFVIREKAPTRAFSWLKAPTTAFTFKTLLNTMLNRR